MLPLPPALTCRPSTPQSPQDTFVPSTKISGTPAYPGCVVPSMTTGSWICGSEPNPAESRTIDLVPSPGMANSIRSGPATFSSAFACSIAALRVQLFASVRQTPSFTFRSGRSPVELTTKVDEVDEVV